MSMVYSFVDIESCVTQREVVSGTLLSRPQSIFSGPNCALASRGWRKEIQNYWADCVLVFVHRLSSTMDPGPTTPITKTLVGAELEDELLHSDFVCLADQPALIDVFTTTEEEYTLNP
ncbi:hypothetical protein B0I72DRAFT_160897 [Yarrowia lipolytica]|uniref:YALI0A08327p n=2 Tax=Yarrowia lipolytica TaxID=4952 RepID=Q6CHJ0_YARLI|nr:YALI0A08327p [Yarrowia lipolytica CLIB122]AOW00396.1 hypothetical protein YALI1_A08047g [Yarrowia lipolytica]KAB8281741.1 hypothetical protein BKA91DRAFT_86689 [Yarrowia lipolytica]KAE8169132.1 hypothetical protein BKA90DRAFT_155551 [Yarrowia lipolytica]KAJ8051476.1 hypothetical protein LXG23DRAFT_51056 [Yarrowia lipolytica]RDW30225.1 hypothetical protein B0I72DRAFT_160897 [Yarrowia lipolytica]|eukprot:XP_499871.1 YALI0A08327p [Yarrowia lipolytica CLIB122]